MRCKSLALLAAVGTRLASSFSVQGLDFPTKLAYHAPSGTLFIAQKAGVVNAIRANSTSNVSAPVLDISAAVAGWQPSVYGYYADLGLTSVAASADHLYALYAVWNASYAGAVCQVTPVAPVDPATTRGCPAAGRLSRWPLAANGSIVGPEEVLMDGSARMCTQFTTLGGDQVALGPDGYLYVSVGVGAREYHGPGAGGYVEPPDYGQYGGDPCSPRNATGGVPGGWGGAFRAQLNGTWAGKVVKVHPVSLNASVVAQGLHNPWRFAFVGPNLYVTDTSIANGEGYEEVNGPLPLYPHAGAAPVNYGFPCTGGGAPLPAYAALNSSLCANASAVSTAPLYSYTPSTFGAGHASISALGAYGGRLYVGDYSLGRVFSVPTTGAASDVRTHLTGVMPVDLLEVPGLGLLYVDVGEGAVGVVPPGGGNGGAGAATLVGAAAALAAAAVAQLLL